MATSEQSMIKNLMAFVEQSIQGEVLSVKRYINYYKGLNLKTSFGQGGFAKIPWISMRGEGQKTSNGIYVGVLCFRKQETLIVTYGTSEENEAALKWDIPSGTITILDYFKKNGLGKPDRYGDCYVFKSYNFKSLDYNNIVTDINYLIEIYKNLLEANSLPREATFVAPDPRGNGAKKEEFDETLEDTPKPKKKKESEKMITTPEPETEASNGAKSFSPSQKVFFGTPGGGKSHKVKVLIEEERKAKDRQFRTTFHPDTDYASFVGSYKPVMKGSDITYAYVPQVFTQAYIAAWNDQDNEYFLDIEEINRGNCAQIFGDLFQLLDRNKDGISEYPIKADADLCDFLENGTDKEGNQVLTNKDGIKNGNLMLPANLSIIATMNTSDQSLFPMDSAFKRRWDWEFVPSTFNEKDNYNITLGNKVYKWHTFLKEANARIKQATDSEDKQMGSYFVKSDMDEEKFKSKVMYYLWSEICKEEYKTQNNFFRYIDKEKNEQEFTFNELYAEGSTKMLQKFMKFMNVSPVNGVEPDEEDKEDAE